MGTGLGKLVRKGLLDSTFGGASYTLPTALYCCLHTGDPADDGSATNECTSTGSYARVDVTNGTSNWNAATTPSNDAPSIVTNKVAFTFPTATAQWASGSAITHFSIRKTSTIGDTTGSNFVCRGTVTPNTNVINTGNTPSFAAGQLSVSMDRT